MMLWSKTNGTKESARRTTISARNKDDRKKTAVDFRSTEEISTYTLGIYNEFKLPSDLLARSRDYKKVLGKVDYSDFYPQLSLITPPHFGRISKILYSFLKIIMV